MANTPLVLDNGSCWIKAGFAGEEQPSAFIPSVMGRLRHTNISDLPNVKDVYVAEEAIMKRGILSLRYPIGRYAHGSEGKSSVCWDDLEPIWDHTYSDILRVDPKEHSVMMVNFTVNNENYRNKISEILFEKHNVPALAIVHPALLSAHASNRKTAVVVDCGHDSTRIHCLHNGRLAVGEGVILNIGGLDLNDYVFALLTVRGFSLTTRYDNRRFRQIKEDICYVSQDFEKELCVAVNNPALAKTVEFMNDQVATFTTERFECAEALFRKDAELQTCISLECMRLPEGIVSAVKACSDELHTELFSNIILSGGTSLLQGLSSRLEKELTSLVPDIDVAIDTSPQQKTLAWYGGSRLACSEECNWTMKSDWEEHGRTSH